MKTRTEQRTFSSAFYRALSVLAALDEGGSAEFLAREDIAAGLVDKLLDAADVIGRA
jgi:hypothetical protein